jgi:hypothetical protein
MVLVAVELVLQVMAQMLLVLTVALEALAVAVAE